MKMKGLTGAGMVLFGVLLGSYSIAAQEVANVRKQEIRVQKKTVMEQYEPGMILTVDDRIKLKKERLATIQKRREIIDTLDISDRKRRRLLKELYGTPHSDQWEKLLTEIEFEDDPDQ